MRVYDITTWTARRYTLSSYDKRALATAIQDRVRQQGLSTKRARGWYLDDIMDTYFIPPKARDHGQESVAIRYQAPTLYVYTSHHLPEAVRSINEEVIAPYVENRRGTAFSEGPYGLNRTKP